jgi:hypothetical protein
LAVIIIRPAWALWIERGSDVVDDRLFRRADKSCRADDDLNDVHSSFGALVQVYAEVDGEVVNRQAAAVEGLQQQHLPDRGRASLEAAPSSSQHATTVHGNLIETPSISEVT